MLNIKRIVAIILLASPLTFWGQGKGSYKINTKGQPISRTEYNLNGEKKSYDYFYFVAGVGPSVLQGDNKGYKPGFEGNIGIGYQLFDFLGFEGKLGFVTLNGDYSNVGIKTHKANALEINANVMLDLTNLIFGYKSTRKFNLVPHVGLGQVHFRNHSVYYNGTQFAFGDKENIDNYNSNPIDENGRIVMKNGNRYEACGSSIGGRKIALAIPVGILVSYKINDYIKTDIDLTVSKVDSEFLDGVIGNSDTKDMYTTLNVRLQYKLKKHKKIYSPCDNGFSNYRRIRW